MGFLERPINSQGPGNESKGARPHLHSICNEKGVIIRNTKAIKKKNQNKKNNKIGSLSDILENIH